MNAIFSSSETTLCDRDLLDAWTRDGHGPNLVISTTTEVHQQIEHLLKVCRESHFGQPPVMKNVEVPAPHTVGGGSDGRGGGGNR